MAPKIDYTDPWTRLVTNSLPIIVWSLIGANFVYRIYQGVEMDCNAFIRPNYTVWQREVSTLPSFPENSKIDYETGYGVQTAETWDKETDQRSNMDEANSSIDNLCWNHGTFVVTKGHETSMRDRLFFPGVVEYDPLEDKLLHQSCYSSNWFGMMIWAFFAWAFSFVWKNGIAMKKIKPLLSIQPGRNSETSYYIRARLFIETLHYHTHMLTGFQIYEDDETSEWLKSVHLGFLEYFRPSLSNRRFGLYFFFSKFLAVILPTTLYLHLCHVIGPLFATYGFDVVKYVISEKDDWPSPMSALFPTVALCDPNQATTGQVSPGQWVCCKLMLNNLTRCTFFVLWWVLAATILLVFFHLVFIGILFFCPWLRNAGCRVLVYRACREQVEAARNYTEVGITGGLYRKRHSIKEVIRVNVSFGDWAVLRFLRINLTMMEFEEFLRQLTSRPNVAIYIRPHREMATSSRRRPIEDIPMHLMMARNIQRNSRF